MTGRADSLPLVRIFVSSPGDVAAEREIAYRVISRLKSGFSGLCRIDGYFWEHEPMFARSDFQGNIPALSEFDIALCILWSRLGSPLDPQRYHRDDGSPFASGTEYEFETALASLERNQRPLLLPFVSRKPVEFPADPEEELRRRAAQYQALDRFKKKWFFDPDRGVFLRSAFNQYTDLAEFERLLESHLRKILEARLAPAGEELRLLPTWTRGSPFRGLSCFEYHHAPIFCGRSRAIDEVLTALKRQAGEGRPFVLIFGNSGGGKSSLLRAGVLPLLTGVQEREDEDEAGGIKPAAPDRPRPVVREEMRPGAIEGIGLWRRAILRPSDGDTLFGALARALTQRRALPGLAGGFPDIVGLARALREKVEKVVEEIRGQLKTLARALKEERELFAEPEARLALGLDQLEELFTLEGFTDEDRTAFIRTIAALARSGLVFVIGTLRSEFFSRCGEIPELVALKAGAGQYHLLPPEAGEMAQIIRQPAWSAGLRFETDAASKARLDDGLRDAAMKNPEALPLLEFALEALYQARTRENLLTFEAYRAIGGLEGALSRRAEETFLALDETARGAFQAVFRRLSRVNHGGAGTFHRQWGLLADLRSVPGGAGFARAFEENRLLTVDLDSQGREIIGVAHEALFEHWPRLKTWLMEERDYFLARARAEAATSRWLEKSRDPDFLLPSGKPLAEAEDLLRGHADELPETVAAFIRASSQRAQEAAQRRLRRLKMIVAGFAVLALLATISAIIAWRQKQIALEQERLTRKTLSRSDFNNAVDSFQLDRANEGVAYLVRSLKEDPFNSPALLSLYHNLAGRNWPREKQPLPTFARAAISPDGRLIAGIHARDDRSFGIFLASSGLPLFTPATHDGRIHSISFSPDGSRIVSAYEDGTARVWETDTGRSASATISHAGPILFARFSHDGRKIVTASQEKTARVWDAMSGKPLTEPLRHDDWVRMAVFSPSDRLVVTASVDKTARVWDAGSGKPVGASMTHDVPVSSAEFSPDEKRVVTFDGGIRIWDVETGSATGEPWQHDRDYGIADLSPDGRYAVVGRDRSARIYDMLTGRFIGDPMTHGEPIDSVRFSPDGRWLLSASRDHTARIWDAATGDPYSEPLSGEAPVAEAEMTPDGRFVLTVSDGGPACLWRFPVETPEMVALKHSSEVLSVRFSPDGRRFVTATRGLIRRGAGREETTVATPAAQLWETASGKALGEPMLHEAAVYSAEFSPDGRFVVTASEDRTARVWDGMTGRPFGIALRHDGKVKTARFSPDGRRVVTASHDQTARVWDAASGKPLGEPMRHDSYLEEASFSPDGSLVVTASTDKTARLWNANSGKPVSPPFTHEGGVTSACFSPDGTRVVTVSWDKTARVWETAGGKPVGEPMRHQNPVNSAAFSPDGRWIVTGAWDRTARVWEAATGKPAGQVMRHGDEVLSAAYSVDGRWIVTASRDGTAKVWEASTCLPVGGILRHRGVVNSASFSPDGRLVIFASEDQTARVWLLNPFGNALPNDEFLRAASHLAGIRLNELGGFERIETDLSGTRRAILASPDKGLVTTLAAWLLADPESRGPLPGP